MHANITIEPVVKYDLPKLADMLYYCKLSLTINRLLVKNWPNEKLQRGRRREERRKRTERVKMKRQRPRIG
jgi:hypothetical protein